MKTQVTLAACCGRLLFASLMCAGVWMMVSASASYVELGATHPFFLEKLPLAHPKWWLVGLYVHVPSALLSLPACLLLLIKRVRARHPAFHRRLGRLTAALVLFAVVPSGLYLAFFAQGGLVTTLGFWLTGLIAFVAMAKSIASARASDMRAHRRFSTHVAAQLSVAVFSRFMLAGAERVGLHAAWVYVAALFLPVIGCALVAELLTAPRRSQRAKGSPHEAVVAVSALDLVR